jgi:sensor histidine kinase regulating citrate/malate metabolism
LIDNALEAAAESDQPYVRLAIIDDEHQYVFILVNATKNNTLAPAVLQKETFQRKGRIADWDYLLFNPSFKPILITFL